MNVCMSLYVCIVRPLFKPHTVTHAQNIFFDGAKSKRSFEQMKMADEEQAISEQVLEEKTEKMEVDSGQSSQVPRLMITKIVNENFKSYAGLKELGPFHKVRDINQLYIRICFGSFVYHVYEL